MVAAKHISCLSPHNLYVLGAIVTAVIYRFFNGSVLI